MGSLLPESFTTWDAGGLDLRPSGFAFVDWIVDRFFLPLWRSVHD
jgi:hypothetical protein